MVSCGSDGLVVAYVDRRLLLGREPRQCVMSRDNTNVVLEHLKIKTRLIGEMFASVMGEYVLLK